MSADLPDADQLFGVSVAGLMLAAALIALGLNGLGLDGLIRAAAASSSHGVEGPVERSPESEEDGALQSTFEQDTERVFEVYRAKKLNLRDSAPIRVGDSWRLGTDIGDLVEGTKVRKISESNGRPGSAPWFEVEVVSGPSTGLQGWVSSAFLRRTKGS